MIKLILLIIILIIITYRYINKNTRDLFTSRRSEDFTFALKIQLITVIPDNAEFLMFNENKELINSPDSNTLKVYQRDDTQEDIYKIPLYTKTNEISTIICIFYYNKNISKEPVINELLESTDTNIELVTQQNSNIKFANIDRSSIDDCNINNITSELSTYICAQINKSTSPPHIHIIEIPLQTKIWDYSNLILEVI
jgi:hypothetical protein